MSPHLHTVTPEPADSRKKKRSYSIDRRLCQDLEVLAWYQGSNSSAVVEKLIEEHLAHHAEVLRKAQAVQATR
ncbi:MAG: hypothetical protein HYY16_15920 [Planctomycetes bacterium]|nr:hypothetical protein [Planctomycetota bacterium]